MKRHRPQKYSATFVETPEGIFTEDGIWFRTRERWIKEYAGGVLEEGRVGELLKEAAVWLRTAQTLALWLLLATLAVATPLQSAVATVAFFALWQAIGPAMVSRWAIPALRVFELVVLQALCFVGVLSWLGASGQVTAVVTGLAGFVMLRWGLLQRLLQPLTEKIWKRLYRMPVPDHVLRALIVRRALRHGITLADFAGIEARIQSHLKKR